MALRITYMNSNLLSLSTMQVLNLLEAMGMEKYKDVFTKECVNGELLLECDDEILEQDLGIPLRLHRVRLMKIITGQHSARELLTGEDPYVRLML